MIQLARSLASRSFSVLQPVRQTKPQALILTVHRNFASKASTGSKALPGSGSRGGKGSTGGKGSRWAFRRNLLIGVAGAGLFIYTFPKLLLYTVGAIAGVGVLVFAWRRFSVR